MHRIDLDVVSPLPRPRSSPRDNIIARLCERGTVFLMIIAWAARLEIISVSLWNTSNRIRESSSWNENFCKVVKRGKKTSTSRFLSRGISKGKGKCRVVVGRSVG